MQKRHLTETIALAAKYFPLASCLLPMRLGLELGLFFMNLGLGKLTAVVGQPIVLKISFVLGQLPVSVNRRSSCSANPEHQGFF